MKIAFLSTFYPYRGGIAQFNGALYRALEKEHEVKAFNFSLQYPKAVFPGKTQYVEEGDEVEKIPTERVLNAMNPASYLTTVKKIKAFQPDVLIIGYWMPYMAPSLGYVAGKMQKHCKVISIVHNAVPHEKGVMDKTLSNYFFKRNKYCIALSEAVQKDITESYPKVNVKVLHHPTYNHFGELVKKEEAFDFLNLDSKIKYLLFFGLIRDYKGLDLLLQTMPLIDEDLHLIVAGEVYGEFQKYQKIIDSNGLNGRVHLHLKYIPDNEVKYCFSIAEAVVLPYKSATQSGIIAVAKHFRIPVVTTDVGGLREFIKHPSEGYVVQNNSPEEIAKGIKKVISNKEVNSLDNQEDRSWDKFAKELLTRIIHEFS
jgi:glycosyltransferase involved in cell wall biosynthesis